MAGGISNLMVLLFLVATFHSPFVSGFLPAAIAKLLSGTQLLNVEGPGMSLIDMQFVLFNIQTTDSTTRETLQALDKKFDNFALHVNRNLQSIKEDITALKLQMSVDFSAAGAGEAEQEIQNQIDRFAEILKKKEELKAQNSTDGAAYRSLASRLTTFLQQAHQPLADNLPKLRRALDGSLTTAQASSEGVLCDVAKTAENQLQTATQQNYDLRKTLKNGPLSLWYSMLRIQETAIYIYNLSCQQINEYDGFCFSDAATLKNGLTSQRNRLLTCLDPLLIALVEEDTVTVRLQTNNSVMGWLDVGREQYPELQSPDDGLAQYVKLQIQNKFYTLFIGGSCFLAEGKRGEPSFCQRVATAEVNGMAVVPKRTANGFMYRLLSKATSSALAPGTACFTEQRAVHLTDVSELGEGGYIWTMTEYNGEASGSGRYVGTSAPTCAASDLSMNSVLVVGLCLTCLQWLLRCC